MERTELNKKIAIYMGYVAIGEHITHPKFGTLTKKGLDLLKYHESWNELMPVVEKINERDWVTIYRDECRIHSSHINEFDTIDIIKEGEPMINAVYEAVGKYVEWFLSNNIK